MGVIEEFVSRAQGQLDDVAQSSFGAVLDGMGALTATMATLAVVMLGVNMVLQYRPMSAGQIVVTFIKLIAIGSIGLVWGQFNLIASAVEGGVDSIAANLLGKFGGGEVPSNNLAGAMDDFITSFSDKANKVMEPMGWMGGAIMSVLIFTSMGTLAALAALLLIFGQVMVTIYLGIAPIFIALSMFEVTKDYFNRWLQGAVSYMLYPLVTAIMLGGLIRIVSGYMTSLDTSITESVSDFIPFIACMVIMTVCTLCIPMIVSSLSGMIMSVTPTQAAIAAVGAKAAGSLAGNAAAASPPARAAAFVGQKAMQQGANYGELALAGSRNLAHRIAERSAKY
ncbi:type IV secretion system protein [Paracoccus sp. WLY502]|uniref:type IV secretion system protein n=1 Tax=Paracoccus yibinensis TaxID=3068891 RepID=UPI00279647CC|nr:type IV secretion system protein [Paracoccus sp. WLY502]MDQ1902192.1 type IV secretion system protein [Paracoccus sp. WLY502]